MGLHVQGKLTGYPGNYNTFLGFRNEPCPPYGCLLELTIQLAVIMIGKQAINNVVEMLLPILTSWYEARKTKKKMQKRAKAVESQGGIISLLYPWEDDYLQLAPPPRHGLFDDYLELVIQVGLVAVGLRSVDGVSLRSACLVRVYHLVRHSLSTGTTVCIVKQQ